MGKDVGKNEVTIIQYNLQHKKVATATLCRRLDVKEDAIALVQEPWIIKTKITGLSSLNGQIFSLPSNQQPRTAIYVPRKIKASLMAQFCTSDVTAVKVKFPWGKGKNREFILAASVDLPLDAATLPPTKEKEDLVDHCLSQRVELIICYDSNSHHLDWGSRDNNARGKSLYNYIIRKDLYILNRDTEPTFINVHSQTFINIWLATAEISNKIQNWQVSEDTSMSDHRLLTYNISLEKSLIDYNRLTLQPTLRRFSAE
ncbi:uncharacterized protein [Diabrotica undecimpunctata]|uniref:uncharacterized protein n=1 Tax=Diabrotica undecimpunctata TaxID=50387 RepID=UPI003B6420CD